MGDGRIVASPEWGWWVVLYFFFGGIAAGSYFIATLIELAREFARAAHQAERRERAFQMYGAPERLAVAHSPR